MALKRIHYGWVVVVASAGVMSTCTLAIFTFGVFLRPLILEFGWERGPLSLAPSIAFIVLGFASVVTGKLSDKYGPRILVSLGGIMLSGGLLLMTQINTLGHVYILWGLFMGLAIGCSVAPILSTIPRWFVQKRGMAVSIVTAGIGVGAIVSPLMAQMLISAHGWRMAFLILGIGAFAIVIPLAQFIRQSPTQMGRRPYGESADAGGNTLADSDKGLPLAKALKTIPFWIFGTIMLFWLFCLQAIVVHIVPHATDIGVPEIAAASILSVMAGCSVAGRVSIGFVSDKLGVRQTLNLCLILSTLALGWLFFAKGVWAFYLFAIAFGLAYGGIAPLVTLVPAELFGMKSLGVIIGTLMLYGTFGEAGGPPFAGYIYDMTGSYHTALLTMAAISGFTAVLGLLLLKYRNKGNRTVASPVR